MQFNYSIGGKSYITNMYFISFLVMSNYVIINILMAFIIDIYSSVEETLEKEEKEKKIFIKLGEEALI